MKKGIVTKEMTDEYKDMIDKNHYSELLLKIAKEFKVERCIQAFQAINTIHNLQQEISKELWEIRHQFEIELMWELENKLPKDEFGKFFENRILSFLTYQNLKKRSKCKNKKINEKGAK